MKANTKTTEAAPVQVGSHAPAGRDGSHLRWLVVNPEGKLLAVLDSESEAYWFTRNRGHADGAVYFKAPCDYAAAPALLAALKELLSCCIPTGHDTRTDRAMAKARAAIAQAEKGES